MTDTDDFLAHYGIKGMRWGVRRQRGKNGRVSTTSRTHYKKPPKNLTNDELQRRIKRMETEKRYNELNKRDISTGQKHVGDVLTHIGKGTIQAVGGAVALYAIKTALFKKFGEDKVGPKPVIFPKKK